VRSMAQTLAKISERAMNRALILGLSEEDLRHMVRGSAHLTHPLGNRRFEKYWFNVEGGELVSMGVLYGDWPRSRVIWPDARSCSYCHGTMRTVMTDKTGRKEWLVRCDRMCSTQRPMPLCDEEN
jgi:hypothetical protein